MSDKFMFITGGASGMGKATVKFFIDKGWSVGCYDINEENLEILSKEINSKNLISKKLDVTNKNDFEQCIKEFSQFSNGKLDILFNNAGIAEGGFFEDQSYENHLKVININFVGVINGIYSSVELLKNTPNSLCLSTSSSTGVIGLPMTSVYSASKHAVKGLTESLSAEFSRFGTRVSDILPGVIDTPLIGEEIRVNLPNEGMWRLISSEEIAKTVLRAYEENRIHWYVPEDLEDLEMLVVKDPIKARDEVIKTGPMKMPSK